MRSVIMQLLVLHLVGLSHELYAIESFRLSQECGHTSVSVEVTINSSVKRTDYTTSGSMGTYYETIFKGQRVYGIDAVPAEDFDPNNRIESIVVAVADKRIMVPDEFCKNVVNVWGSQSFSLHYDDKLDMLVLLAGVGDGAGGAKVVWLISALGGTKQIGSNGPEDRFW